MYGYEVILESPDRSAQVALRLLAERHYKSVRSLLGAQGLPDEYRGWRMLSFRCAYAQTPRSRPVHVQSETPKPGTLVSLYV